MQKKLNNNILKKGLFNGIYLGSLLLFTYLFGLEHSFTFVSMSMIYLISFIIGIIGAYNNELNKSKNLKAKKKWFIFTPLQIIWNLQKVIILVITTLVTYFLFGQRIAILTIVLTLLTMAIIQTYSESEKK